MKKIYIFLTVGLILIIMLTACTDQNKYPNEGRDTIIKIGNGKFEIGKFGNNKALVMYYENNTLVDTLLSYVKSYQKKDNKLYVISEEGYGIVDGETNTCILCVTVEKQYADRLNNPEENKRITMLDSYDSFTEQEQAIFNEIKNKKT